jgi:hypothetical protein
MCIQAFDTLGRQLLFPWRDLPRKCSHGRTLALTIAVLLVEALAVVQLTGSKQSHCRSLRDAGQQL